MATRGRHSHPNRTLLANDALQELSDDVRSGQIVVPVSSVTWDQETEIARHAQPDVATQLPVYFAHPTRLGNGPAMRTPTG